MASIHKKNKYWYIAFKDGLGQRHFVSSGILHSPPGKDKKEIAANKKFNRGTAIILATQMEQTAQGDQRPKLLRKRYSCMIASARESDAQQSGVTVRYYFDRWVVEKTPRVGISQLNKLKCCKSEFYDVLENRADDAIVQVDEEDISEYVDFLISKELGGVTINQRLNILKEMFSDAEKKSFVIVTPVEDDHYQEESPVERLDLTFEQTGLILGATTIVDWHTATLFASYCGMRLGDSRSQTWAAIDFERRVITWIPEKTIRKRAHKAKTIITPIHPVLYRHLVRVRAMCGGSAFVTPFLAKRPISNLSDEFIEIMCTAGIDPLRVTLPNGRIICQLSFHSGRHKFTTELKRVGAPDKEWSKLTGHSVPWSRWNDEPISNVAQRYNHVDVSDLRKWINSLQHLTLPHEMQAKNENKS